MNRRRLKKARDRIAALESRHGTLTVDIVLDDARRANSPLHACFEWDDAAAAEKYRRDQARELIASVRYTWKVDEHTYSAPNYVSDPRADQGYVSVDRLRSDKDLAREALVAEYARAASHLNRAYEIEKALGFEPSEAAAIAAQVGAVRARLEIGSVQQAAQ